MDLLKGQAGPYRSGDGGKTFTAIKGSPGGDDYHFLWIDPQNSQRMIVASATVNDAHILVDYGRPSVRGRTVFGGIVPWNEVWRTGANVATQLATDKELVFGSSIVPAGTYSLFTIPSRDGWLLIINKQHGQWGTIYDQTKDLFRIPLETKSLPDLVEQFTFEVSSQDGRGVLSFKWERTMASVFFAVH